jgi:hypothetical protein
MFLVNQEGRVVDLPARLEKEGLAQAREVLSISRELMNGETTGVLMTDMDTLRLKQEILSRFPNVITDDEYLYLHPVKLPEKVESEPIPKVEIERAKEFDTKLPPAELVNELMTKNDIVKVAKENGIIIDSKKQREAKANLVSYVNDKNKR